MRKFAFLAALLLLPACAGVQAPTGTPATSGAPAASQAAAVADPLSKLAAFTVADLQAASADAKAQVPPDETAFRCYDYLAGVIPTLKPPSLGSGGTVGAVLAFQKARDLANGTVTPNGMLKQLNLACAPLVIDVTTTVNKILLLGAGTAATGGALGPALPGLGALGATLPIPLP